MSAVRKRTVSKSNINFDIIKKSFIGTFKKFAEFKGRARRREFWIFFFCTWILGLIPFIGQIITLVTCIPSLAVGVRRLHDTNRSGLWLLFLIFIPLPLAAIIIAIVFIVKGFDFFTAMGTGLWFLGLILLILIPLIGITICLFWAAQEGTRGKNRYGPDPKATRSR